MERTYGGLQLLRFLCASIVIFSHYHHFFVLSIYPSFPDNYHREAQPFYNYAVFIYDNGGFAVKVFWQLSGFIFYYKYSEAIFSNTISVYKFLVLRLSRLYPLHFITLIFVAVAQWHYAVVNGTSFVYDNNDIYHFVLNLFFMSQWGFQKGLSFNGPIWSVSLECIAYITFFLFARYGGFSLSKTLCSLSVLFAVHLLIGYTELIDCVIYFFVGGCICILSKEIERFSVWYLVPIMLLTTASALYFFIKVPDNNKTMLFLSSSLLVSFAMISKAMILARIGHVSNTIGNMTYASYLVHFPIQIVLVSITDYFVLDRSLYFNDAVFIFYFVCVFIVSYLTYAFFERPAQEKIRKLFLPGTAILELGIAAG
ncbi:MAG: acyltransferase family protein [Beijerinckiaceae bacterium]